MSAPRQGMVVAAAGTGVNLALGVLYAWSVIKGGIPDSWGWSNADKALPYSVACLVFAIAMIPAGRLQDRLGPRWVATLGGLLTGTGFMVAGLAGASLWGFVLGFGALAGMGIGFGYASTTPAAVKWFPSRMTGAVTGVVVAGFGLAPVYIAPLVTWLLKRYARPGPGGGVELGISHTMLVLGAGFLVVVVLLAQLIRNPPAVVTAPGATAPGSTDRTWRQMLATGQFYLLWVIYFAGAAAGLTFISVAQSLGKKSLGERAFLAVVVLAVGNASGRIIAGRLSDQLGRELTLYGALLMQAAAVSMLYLLKGGAGWPVMLAIVFVIGGAYGANLALFPAAAKDYFGLAGFGLNYGCLFTAWGAAGLVMPWVNGYITDTTGSDRLTYFIILGMLVAGALLAVVSRTRYARAGLAR